MSLLLFQSNLHHYIMLLKSYVNRLKNKCVNDKKHVNSNYASLNLRRYDTIKACR